MFNWIIKKIIGTKNQRTVKRLWPVVAEINQMVGFIDVMINNAGISMRALFIDLQLDVMRRLMDTNYWGTVYCSKFAIPHLLKTSGSLVGVISIGGFIGMPGRSGWMRPHGRGCRS